MKNIKSLLLVIALLASTATFAQLKTPQPSPTATVSQAVGLGEVTIEYSRPGAKDRKVFGELVPFDVMWRTGANASSKIEFSEDVTFGGKEVPAGKYAFYTIPGATEWTIVLSKNLELWGEAGYKETDDQTRFTVKPMKITDMVESFTMDFSNFTSTGAHLNLSWENTKVAITIETKAMEMIENQITEIMAGPDAGTYYSAARFYLENDKDINKASTWINKACEMRPEAFWYVHQKAKIQAKLGDKKAAIATATKSLEMAKANKEGDYGYILSNEKLLKELAGK